MRRYERSDFEMIKDWSGVPLNILPKTGFIVPNVAVGFLVATDTNYCFLEPFIGNPKVDKEERDVAIFTIIDELLAEAKRLGYDLVFGVLSHPKMIERGMNRGFVKIIGNQQIIGRKL